MHRKRTLLGWAAAAVLLFSLLNGCASPAGAGSLAEEEVCSTEVKALENEAQRAVLSLSLEEFITAYNRGCRETQEADSLPPPSEWTVLEDVTRLWEYPCRCHSISADPQVYTMPRVLVYTPEDGDEIYEIELLFDDHSYQEAFYEAFQRIYHNTLQALLPRLGDGARSNLYEALYAQMGAYFLGDYYVSPKGDKPMPDKIYRCGTLGLYGYYGSGTDNICILPLTEGTVAQIEQSGITVVPVS